jgi:uncharacterized protein YecT (DUF1311 family)
MEEQFYQAVQVLQKNRNLEMKAALERSQKDWLAYRSSQCSLVELQWKGGSGQGAAISGCQSNLAKLRAKELAELGQ